MGTAIEAGEGDDWLNWLAGDMFTGESAEAAADALAAENDAHVSGFSGAEVNGYPGFDVEVTTDYTVGDSILPGTESQHAKADATAVIKPRCELAESSDPEQAVGFTCDGDEAPIEIDPDDFELGDLPDASTLFSVHLAD